MAKNSKSNRKGLEALGEVVAAEPTIEVAQATVEAALDKVAPIEETIAQALTPVAEVVAANVAEVLDAREEFITLGLVADEFLTQVLRWNQALDIHNKAVQEIASIKEQLKKDKKHQQDVSYVDELKRQLIAANVAPTHPAWNAVRRMRQILEDEVDHLLAPAQARIEAVKPVMAERAAWTLANDKEWKAWKASHPKGADAENK